MPRQISLLLALLWYAYLPVSSRGQGYFTYEKTFEEHQKDAAFQSVLNVTIEFRKDFGAPKLSVYRGPTQVFGIKGSSRTFQGGRLECDLTPEEAEEVRRILDGLELQRFPDKPDFSKAGRFPWGLVNYGEVVRGFAVVPEEGHARRTDEAVEGIIKKAAEQGRYWRPEVRVFPGDDQSVRTVTLAELTADPLKYHGQRVRVAGYYTHAFEDSSLWADAAAKSAFDVRHSVWIGGASAFADRKSFDQSATRGNKMVIIEGTFDAAQNGHLGGWPGSIERTTRFALATDKPRAAK